LKNKSGLGFLRHRVQCKLGIVRSNGDVKLIPCRLIRLEKDRWDCWPLCIRLVVYKS